MSHYGLCPQCGLVDHRRVEPMTTTLPCPTATHKVLKFNQFYFYRDFFVEISTFSLIFQSNSVKGEFS